MTHAGNSEKLKTLLSHSHCPVRTVAPLIQRLLLFLQMCIFSAS